MARRNHSLVFTLLVMIAALIVAILWGGTPPTNEPGPSSGSPGAKPQTGPIVAVSPDEIALRGRLVVGAEPAAGVEIGYDQIRPFSIEIFSDSGESRVTVTTDEAGYFAFVVDLDRSGRLSVARDTGFLFVDDEGLPAGELTVGGYSADHDLGTIDLLRTAAIAGRILDSDGAVVVGAIVRASSIGFESDPERGATARTDEQGRFEMAGLYPGSIRLRAEGDGFRPLEQDLELASGQSESDLELTLVRGLSITGRIVDDAGLPLPGVRVVALAEDGSELAATESGPFAFYELGGLEDAVVTVQASSPNHAPLRIEGLKAGTAGQRLRLRRLGRISGSLVGRDGRPIAGSRVVATTLGRASRISATGGEAIGARETTTDENGGFVLEDVVPGTLVLVASGDGHLPARSNAPITLRPGQSIEYLRIQAVRAATLNVDVVDLEGTRVADAEVVVEAVGRVIGVTPIGGESASVPASRTRRIASARTGAEGRATFDQLPPEQLRLVARHRRYAPSKPVEIRLDPTDAKELLLTVLPAGGLALVARTPSGVGLAGLPFQVSPLDDPEGVRRVETDGEGRVVVEGLAPGTHRIALLEPNLDGADELARIDAEPREFEVAAGEAPEVLFELPLRSRLRGVVSNADGPVAQVRIELRADGSDLRLEALSDASGNFVIESIDPGTWFVELRSGEQSIPVVRRIELPGGGASVTGSFDLSFGGLAAEIVDDLGAGREGVLLELRPTDPQGSSVVEWPDRSAADGSLRIASIPTGVYEFRFSAPGLVPQRVASAAIVAGEVTSIPKVTLQRTSSLSGGVAPEALQAAPGPWVVQWRRAREDQDWESGGRRRPLDESGRFELTDLEPGRYELRILEAVEEGTGRVGAIRTIDLAPGTVEDAALELPEG